MLVILKKIDEYYYKPLYNGRVNPNLEWLLSKVNEIVKIEKYDRGIGYLIIKDEDIRPRFAIHDHQFSEYFGEFNFDKYFEETDF